MSPVVSSFSAGTLGGGSAGGSAMILRASQAPALHRVRFPAVRQTRHDGRLREHAAQLRAAVLNGDELEAAIGLFGQVVVAGDGFVGHHEIGLNQIPDRQVVPDQVLQKLNRLLLQLGARVAGELGIPLAVRFQHLELIQAQPLRRKLAGEPREARDPQSSG